MCALVCEKFGRHADALPWAKLASSDDCSNLGSNDPFVHVEGHRVRGRCLAQLGQTTEATEAFETAIDLSMKVGLFLHELLALSELVSLKLGGDREVLMARMKAVAVKMVGEGASPEQLESLAKAKLASGVTLVDIMAS